MTRGSTRPLDRAAWPAAAAAVLLLAVAAGGAGTRIGAADAHTPTQLAAVAEWTLAYAVTAAFVLLGVALVVRSMRRREARGSTRFAPRRTPRQAAITLLVQMLVLILIAFVWARRLHQQAQSPRSTAPPAAPAGAGRARPAARLPEFPWSWFVVSVALVVAVIAAGLLMGSRRDRARRRNARPRSRRWAGRAADDDDDELVALALHAEPRAAVRASYELARRSLSRRGLGALDSEAPREYAARIGETSGSRLADPLRLLTSLYEHARFSSRPVDEYARSAAVATMQRVRDEPPEPHPESELDHDSDAEPS